MRNERQIAELIFDRFRASNSKAGHIVMFRVLQFNVIDKLNPKEKELFDIVVNGLILTGYVTYENGSPEYIRLTEKGYDYIYDDEKVELKLKTPWVIPSVHKPDWDKAYFKLWKVIGPQDTATHYIKGSQFYKLIMELCDDIPPSYNKYIEHRTQKELSTSRIDYYKELIDHLDEEKRKELYVNIQLILEGGSAQNNDTQEELSFDTTFDVPEIKAQEEIFVQPQVISSANTAEVEEIIPTVFISYSWDNQEHENWIVSLTTKLRENGVDAILDKWDLGSLGKLLPHFMENSIAKSQRVICVMTPNYKKKTDKLAGGVGYEYSIISAEIFTDGVNTSKFIPLFRAGTEADAIPSVLRGRKYVDMRNDAEFEEKFFHELLRDIHEAPKYKKPAIGKKPSFD